MNSYLLLEHPDMPDPVSDASGFQDYWRKKAEATKYKNPFQNVGKTVI